MEQEDRILHWKPYCSRLITAYCGQISNRLVFLNNTKPFSTDRARLAVNGKRYVRNIVELVTFRPSEKRLFSELHFGEPCINVSRKKNMKIQLSLQLCS